jgi:D-alanyl-D-alanine carboxypeptidase/D-alanyl-D-alanine-endopeptidase (penicillin-binding protein 4)
MPEFVASMPIVGIDGTMKKRLKDATATGRAHIKTGTLDGVKTAAGYALDARGRRYASPSSSTTRAPRPAAPRSTH